MRIVKIDRLIVALSIFSGILVSLGRSTQVYPQQISGNGNLGFLPLLLLFPIVCGILYQIEQFSQYQVLVKQQVIADRGTIDGDYLTSITSMPSPYMNSQYFNGNTFLIYWASILLMASLIAWWTREEWQISESD